MGRVTEALLATPHPRATGRMGWSVLLLASLLAGPVLLQPVEQADLEEQEQMRELFLSVFIDNHRAARDLDAEDEDEDEADLETSEDDQEEMEKEMEEMEVDRMG